MPLLFNRPRTQQPQQLVGVDWNNPFSRNLSFALVPSSGLVNIVNHQLPLQVTNGKPIKEVGLLGVRFRGEAGGGVSAEFSPNGLNASGNNLTLLSIWRARDAGYSAGDGSPHLLSCRTAGNAGWSWGRNNAVAGGSLGNRTRQSLTFQGVSQYLEANNLIDSQADSVVACRVRSTTASWFLNGQKSSADTTVGTSSVGGNLIYMNQGPYGTTSGWVDRNYLLLAWSRALSDAEIVAVSANPWQLFAQQPRQLWLDVVAGATFNQSVFGSVTLSGLISRQTNKILVGSETVTGVVTKQTSKTLTGSETLSGVVPKQTNKTLVGSETVSGTIARQTNKLVVGTETLSGNPTKETRVTEQGSITTSAGPVTGGSFNQNAAGSITLTSVLSDAVTFVRVYGSSITLSGIIVKPVSKILSGTITLVGNVYKSIAKATFTASLTLSSALSAFSFTPSPGSVIGRGLRFMRRFIGRR